MITEKSKKSQLQRLSKFFRNGGKITSLEAAQNHFITSLHRRLSDLKQEPYNMEFDKEIVKENGNRFYRYSLKK